ncbi:MAG: OadG family protein [Lachnospiraceae bacterium]|nr:OadG family protein [Lachnospiraceae bacterium]
MLNNLIFLATGTKITFAEGLVNTVVSIIIVFVALMLIMGVIYLFNFINIFEKKMNEKKNAKAALAQKNVPVIETKEETVSEELSDDSLIAVITAAIYEYEALNGNAVSNGLVVKSIKRR